MTKEQLQGMLAEGFNLNQIAAIYMINKASLEMLLIEGTTGISPVSTSGKTTTTTIKTTSAGGTEGTSGGSGYGESTTSGWQNEEGL